MYDYLTLLFYHPAKPTNLVLFKPEPLFYIGITYSPAKMESSFVIVREWHPLRRKAEKMILVTPEKHLTCCCSAAI